MNLNKEDIEFFTQYTLNKQFDFSNFYNYDWNFPKNIKFIMFLYKCKYSAAFNMMIIYCKSNKIKIDLDWLEDDNGNLIEQE
jgi:hypothetical protein